jgi:hypothetical protein
MPVAGDAVSSLCMEPFLVGVKGGARTGASMVTPTLSVGAGGAEGEERMFEKLIVSRTRSV